MISRRDFLKLVGLGAVAGGAKTVPAELFAAAKPAADAKGLAMVIDLKKCSAHKGCRDCRKACHVEHNVPEIAEPKHEIKWIWKEMFAKAFHGPAHEFLAAKTKHLAVPVLCNHCQNPPCVKVCPTQATWKREEDGVVMMDWHRCIGCRYCMVACPYGARSFNWKEPRPLLKKIRDEFPTRSKGVVEKCTFCEERLAKGKRPACVEACKAKAMTFGDVGDAKSGIRRLLASRFSIVRKPELGTGPRIYYLLP